jgi:hypothetical protein
MTNPEKKRLALIAGPTASGKTALALALARRHDVTIINADSAQVYANLPVLSAQPSAAEMASAPHRLFGYLEGREACSAAKWAGDAKAAIAETWDASRLPVLVGGTGSICAHCSTALRRYLKLMMPFGGRCVHWRLVMPMAHCWLRIRQWPPHSTPGMTAGSSVRLRWFVQRAEALANGVRPRRAGLAMQ